MLIPLSILTFTFILFVFHTSSYVNYQEIEEKYHLHEAVAEPAADYPIPHAERMFTNDGDNKEI